MPETNQINWVGVRPIQPRENIQTHMGPFETSVCGVTRAQINKSRFEGVGTYIMHTVTAAKVFYLTAFTFGAFHTVTCTALFYVRNVADVTQYNIYSYTPPAANYGIFSLALTVPIAIPAGYDITIYCDAGTMQCFISGWEEDA